MLRITRKVVGAGGPTLKLEGRLVGPWVDLLKEECEAFLKEADGPITLEATEVGFASEAGLRLLLELHDRSVARLTCSSFLHHLIADRCQLPQKTDAGQSSLDNQFGRR